ncbi:hypothetical protein FB451DRAFT_1411223 [Mycena latifolia]|nr:hypothetical protein FB451DRAFT_1411223 [Mycena latifolia]
MAQAFGGVSMSMNTTSYPNAHTPIATLLDPCPRKEEKEQRKAERRAARLANPAPPDESFGGILRLHARDLRLFGRAEANARARGFAGRGGVVRSVPKHKGARHAVLATNPHPRADPLAAAATGGTATRATDKRAVQVEIAAAAREGERQRLLDLRKARVIDQAQAHRAIQDLEIEDQIQKQVAEQKRRAAEMQARKDAGQKSKWEEYLEKQVALKVERERAQAEAGKGKEAEAVEQRHEREKAAQREREEAARRTRERAEALQRECERAEALQRERERTEALQRERDAEAARAQEQYLARQRYEQEQAHLAQQQLELERHQRQYAEERELRAQQQALLAQQQREYLAQQQEHAASASTAQFPVFDPAHAASPAQHQLAYAFAPADPQSVLAVAQRAAASPDIIALLEAAYAHTTPDVRALLEAAYATGVYAGAYATGWAAAEEAWHSHVPVQWGQQAQAQARRGQVWG